MIGVARQNCVIIEIVEIETKVESKPDLEIKSEDKYSISNSSSISSLKTRQMNN